MITINTHQLRRTLHRLERRAYTALWRTINALWRLMQWAVVMIVIGITAAMLTACGGGGDLNDDGTLIKIHDDDAPTVPQRCEAPECK